MNIVLAITGATGAHAARIFMQKSVLPVTLIVSKWGERVFNEECGPIEGLIEQADHFYRDDDLAAPIASGGTATAGMVILPCTTHSLGMIAGGLSDTLISRAAHCHLKEGRRLLLCIRETPWSGITIENARRVAGAGGTIMPMSPPFYAVGESPDKVTMTDLLSAFVDRVMTALGLEQTTQGDTDL